MRMTQVCVFGCGIMMAFTARYSFAAPQIKQAAKQVEEAVAVHGHGVISTEGGIFKFLWSDGILEMQHYAPEGLGFFAGRLQPSPVKDHAPLFVIILYTAAQLSGKDTSAPLTLVLAKMPLLQLDAAHYSLGTDYVQIKIETIRHPEDELNGQEPQEEPIILTSASATANTPRLDVRGIPKVKLTTEEAGSKVSKEVPVLAPDEILSLARQQGQTIRAYYADESAPWIADAGYYEFKLEGNRLTVQHYSKQKMRFGSKPHNFEATVVDYPVHIGVRLRNSFFLLDPMELLNSDSATFTLPAQVDRVQITVAEPHMLTQLYSQRPLTLLNSIQVPEILASKPMPKESILISDRKLAKAEQPKAVLTLNYMDERSGIKANGAFEFRWISAKIIAVKHRYYGVFHHSAAGSRVSNPEAPNFNFKFHLSNGKEIYEIDLPSEAFANLDAEVHVEIVAHGPEVQISIPHDFAEAMFEQPSGKLKPALDCELHFK